MRLLEARIAEVNAAPAASPQAELVELDAEAREELRALGYGVDAP